MAKVIETILGQLLISRINAGSFRRGDMIAIGGAIPAWISNTAFLGDRAGYGKRVNLTINHWCSDGTISHYTCEFGLNEPQWLVIGGNSGGLS